MAERREPCEKCQGKGHWKNDRSRVVECWRCYGTGEEKPTKEELRKAREDMELLEAKQAIPIWKNKPKPLPKKAVCGVCGMSFGTWTAVTAHIEKAHPLFGHSKVYEEAYKKKLEEYREEYDNPKQRLRRERRARQGLPSKAEES